MNMSTSTPIYRPLDLEHDFIPLVALLNEIKRADHNDEIISEADLHDMLTGTGQDPATNTWVVTAPNSASLIGCGLILKAPNDEHADLLIAVHPSWRGQGIGSQIFTFLLERARALNTRAVRGYVDIQHRAADHFARNRGFEPVSTYTRLTVSASRPFPGAVLPPGFVTRSYDQVQRIDLLTQAITAATRDSGATCRLVRKTRPGGCPGSSRKASSSSSRPMERWLGLAVPNSVNNSRRSEACRPGTSMHPAWSLNIAAPVYISRSC
jgi:GNAT superfamily N-acetyltransferase